jgi:hypothetical protein
LFVGPWHPRPQVLEALADRACNRVGVVGCMEAQFASVGKLEG